MALAVVSAIEHQLFVVRTLFSMQTPLLAALADSRKQIVAQTLTSMLQLALADAHSLKLVAHQAFSLTKPLANVFANLALPVKIQTCATPTALATFPEFAAEFQNVQTPLAQLSLAIPTLVFAILLTLPTEQDVALETFANKAAKTVNACHNLSFARLRKILANDGFVARSVANV